MKNSGSMAATSATVEDRLPDHLVLTDGGIVNVTVNGDDWICTNPDLDRYVTCTFSGSIAANGGTTVLSYTVTPRESAVNEELINYASIDPTGGTNPPEPNPGTNCTTTTCSSVSSVVRSAKRTEAIVHNFLADRGQRIAAHGLNKTRLISRLKTNYAAASEPCGHGNARP